MIIFLLCGISLLFTKFVITEKKKVPVFISMRRPVDVSVDKQLKKQ